MILPAFIGLTTLFLTASCYECNGTTTIEMPTDMSQPTFYPRGWFGNGSVPRIDRNQACTLLINIRSGYYANVTFYKHFESLSDAYLVYSNNHVELINDDDQNPFIFTSPRFKVNLLTSKNTSVTDFAFKIVWNKFPKNIPKKTVNIYKGNPPVAVSPSNALVTFVTDPNSLMSVMGFSLVDPSMNYLLRQSLLFGGSSVTDDFIGTLSELAYSHQKVTTYGNKISVYTFGLSNFIDYPLFMGQDYTDASKVMIYDGANCPSSGNCNITLYGTWGRSWTVTDYNGPEYIKGFEVFPDTATISVYENQISNTTCIATLTSSNYKQQLPLEVKGTMKIYDLQGVGNTVMVVTRDVSRASRLSN